LLHADKRVALGAVHVDRHPDHDTLDLHAPNESTQLFQKGASSRIDDRRQRLNSQAEFVAAGKADIFLAVIDRENPFPGRHNRMRIQEAGKCCQTSARTPSEGKEKAVHEQEHVHVHEERMSTSTSAFTTMCARERSTLTKKVGSIGGEEN